MGKPKVPTIKPTAQELQQFDIAKQKLANYQQVGVPLQNRYIQMTTGKRWDGQQWQAVPNGVLGADGLPRTDAGQALAQAAKQWKPALQVINPNAGMGRLGNLDVWQQKAASDAGIEQQTRWGQQSGYLDALNQVAGIGRGQVSGTLNGLGQLTQNAAQQASAAAGNAMQTRLDRQMLLGGLVGAGQTALLGQVQTRNARGEVIDGAVDKALLGWWGK